MEKFAEALFKSLIRGYEKAYYDKKGQEVQQEVCKDIKKANKTVPELSVATEKRREKRHVFCVWPL